MSMHLIDVGGFSMGLWSLFMFAMFFIAIISTILTVCAVVSIMRKETQAVERVLWLVIVLMVGLIGPIIYFAIGSSMLDKKANMQDNNQTNKSL